jgi:hypothetical protein
MIQEMENYTVKKMASELVMARKIQYQNLLVPNNLSKFIDKCSFYLLSGPCRYNLGFSIKVLGENSESKTAKIMIGRVAKRILNPCSTIGS